ncbi:MAG: sulfurtransferase TusA family protein [Armatimonadota bacterium]
MSPREDPNSLPADEFSVIGVTPNLVVDGGDLDCGTGLLLVIRRAMNQLEQGQVLEVDSTEISVRQDLPAWCRMTKNQFLTALDGGDRIKYLVRKGPGTSAWGEPDWGVELPRRDGRRVDIRDWFVGRVGEVPEEAPTYFGFVPRGAVAEPGMPDYGFALNRKDDVWADNIADLYEQAKAAQWDASTSIAWGELPKLDEDVERAVCQIMTFLAENEYSALYIPSKFMPQINPQFTEVVLFLATVVNDEARHIEAFTKRALANGGGLQYASAATEWSLFSLLIQEDYFNSSFLLHVLGEGTFLDLLRYCEQHAPDPVTRDVVQRARQDEARHVAYGVAHLKYQLERHPDYLGRLMEAVEARADAISATTGATPFVMEALAVLGGGGASPAQMSAGVEKVRALYQRMADNRVQRLTQAGVPVDLARKMSEMHTPNFM